MNTKSNNDYSQDISSGLVENKSFWFKFGEGEIDTTLTTLWKGSAVQAGLYVYPTTATIMNLVSSNAADTGQTVIINGLDANWKLQSEIVTTSGTTEVPTVYKYLRVFRISVLTGNNLTGNLSLTDPSDNLIAYVAGGGEKVNQTQMAFYSVPAGHKLLLDTVDISKLDENPCEIYMSLKEIGKYGATTPLRSQLNWNIKVGNFEQHFDHPFPVDGKTDLEIRGIATSVTKTGNMAVNLFGTLDRISSVPVAITNFTATSGDTEVTLSWDEQTPAETSDMKGFNISNGIDTVLVSAKDASSYTWTGLTNGTEYTFSITWVGYDDKTSSTSTATATPNPIVPYFPLIGGLATVDDSGNDAAYITIAEDETITEANFGLTDYFTTNTAHINGVSYLVAIDTAETNRNIKLYSYDGTDFTLIEENISSVASCDEFAYFSLNDGQYIELAGGSRYEINVPTGMEYAGMYGEKYMLSSYGTPVYLSDDGINFTAIANPVGIDFILSITDGTKIYAMYRDGTTLGFYIYDGSWTLATTSFTVADEQHFGHMAVYDGNLYAIYNSSVDYATGFVTSADGDTWTTMTPPDANVPNGLSVAHDKLWTTSIALAGFASKVFYYDGSDWDEGQAITTGNRVYPNSIK